MDIYMNSSGGIIFDERASSIKFQHFGNDRMVLDNSYLGFYDATGSVMRIVSGNVGIGTTSPSAKLSVAGSATDNAYFFYDNADVGDTTNGQSLYVYRRAAEGDTSVRTYVDQWNYGTITSEGADAGLNLATETGPLTLNGADGVRVYNWHSNRTFQQFGYITAATDDKYIQWQVSDTTDNFELIREDSNIGYFDVQMPTIFTGGNVGIGTTAPGAKLDVNGRIRMGTWTADGDTAVYYNSSTGDIGVTASDERLKKNVQTIENPLDIVMGIRGVTFNWKNPAMKNVTQIGVIAQEVAGAMPELTFPIVGPDGKDYLGVHYDKLSPLLIEAVKEQQSAIVMQTEQLETLTLSTIENVESMLDFQTKINDNFTVVGAKINDLETRVANLESGELLSERIDAIEEKIVNDDVRVDNLEDRLSELTTTVENLNLLATQLTDQVIEHDNRLSAIEELVEMGDVTTGAGELTIQLAAWSSKLAVESFNEDGSPLFALDGSLKVKKLQAEEVRADTVVAGDYTVKNDEGEETKNTGSTIIQTGQQEVFVENDKVKNTSRIIVTPVGNNPIQWIVSDKRDNEGFVIRLDKPAEFDVAFDFWIVQTE